MATLFTRIIDRELPGRFVYEDEKVVAFLTIAPIKAGHTLVVPRNEVDDWLDLPADDRAALFAAAHTVGVGVRRAFPCAKVALLAVGLEVPHVHLHLVPIDNESEVSFANADPGVAPDVLDDAQERIVAALGNPDGAGASGTGTAAGR
jgi:diadenosine tetraphosphate (Ap4A) HIT family hydrolase